MSYKFIITILDTVEHVKNWPVVLRFDFQKNSTRDCLDVREVLQSVFTGLFFLTKIVVAVVVIL